ncbi:aminoglycoside phosphotransferase family protein [Gorillibacterium timonense]|uniref:aminoglycoside phosphotransferase family protein n=1 Tax=Gorillibacterium timonense TaxID=1689269 RepID=UPI00071E3FD5|nr:aminoglycoside phosphotransferase family protein [Gorillibacterium timonense]
MSNLSYQLNFEKLCMMVELGELVGAPVALTGGLLHKMFAIQTTQGKYAIKALNPQIMCRPTAMHNFIHSENIAAAAAKNVSAHPAKRFNNTAVQQVDHQYFLVFDWVEGRSLKPNEITTVHCEIMGDLLADIHRTDFTDLANTKDELLVEAQPTDWNSYLQQGLANHSEWASSMQETIEQLYDWNRKAIHAGLLLGSNTVISHRDLDSKNVMWNQNNPILIDWEAAGSINPMQDLLETAIYWSEDETGSLDKMRLSAFLSGYKKKQGPVQADWKTVVENGFMGKLGWLEYSLKRSLRIECTDENEQQVGTEQVIATIDSIKRYASMVTELEQWLNDECR